jgi:hypothetical protein
MSGLRLLDPDLRLSLVFRWKFGPLSELSRVAGLWIEMEASWMIQAGQTIVVLKIW